MLALHSIAINAQTENNQGLPNVVDREAFGRAGSAVVVLAPFGTDRERIWTPYLGEYVAGGAERQLAHSTKQDTAYLIWNNTTSILEEKT